MVYWDPFEDMRRIHQELNSAFGSFYGRNLEITNGKHIKCPARMPVSGLRETDTEVIATFEIPGAKKEDIELNLTDDSIEVRATRKCEKEEKGRESYEYASVSRSFYKKVMLGTEVKPEQAAAECRDGILTVTIPKAETRPKTRRIEVR